MTRKVTEILSVFAAAAAAVLLIVYAPAACRGAIRGIAACGKVILPAVFPFLAVSVYLAGSGAGDLTARLLSGVTRRCYRLPPQASSAVLMSWIGGYPAGAKVLAELARQGKITRKEAAEGAVVCINSGPAYMAGVVGAGIFGAVEVGIFLFLCQLAAGLLTARVMSMGRTLPLAAQEKTVKTRQTAAALLVHSVTSAAGSAVNICAFVILLAAAGEVLTACGVFPLLERVLTTLSGGALGGETANCLLLGLLEICAGSAAAAELPPTEAAKILPFLLSFGGISICCQVAACFDEEGLPWGRLLTARLLHGTLTALLARPWLPVRAAALVMTGAPTLAVGGWRLWWGSICMVTLCGMLIARWQRPAWAEK